MRAEGYGKQIEQVIANVKEITPVSTNHVWKHTCRGGRLQSYLTPEGRALKEAYQWEAKAQYHGGPLSGPVEVAITLYFPNRRRRDWDNRPKLTMDALTGIVWHDDSQIEEATVRKTIDRERPRIEITICPAEAV